MTGDTTDPVPEGHSFALCLSHDVDRVAKTYQGVFHAVRERDPGHLRSVLSSDEPYWGFDDVMALEDDLGVRSAFNFLNEKRLIPEKSPRAWVDPRCWLRYNYYDIESPEIRAVLTELDEGGWEIGLHGSYDTDTDVERLAYEKRVLEELVDQPIRGGRQHFLNLSVPKTWEAHRDIGLGYDSSSGSGSAVGFEHGYGIQRPFDDEFVVFPLTIMDQAVMPADGGVEAAWDRCEDLLEEARENRAVMSIDWHQRVFSAPEFEGWGTIYRRIIEYALDEGAWVGPPGDLYDQLDHPLADADDDADDHQSRSASNDE